MKLIYTSTLLCWIITSWAWASEGHSTIPLLVPFFSPWSPRHSTLSALHHDVLGPGKPETFPAESFGPGSFAKKNNIAITSIPDPEEVYLVSFMYFAVYLWLSPYLLPQKMFSAYLMSCDILWSLQALTFQIKQKRLPGGAENRKLFIVLVDSRRFIHFTNTKYKKTLQNHCKHPTNIKHSKCFTGCLLATSTGAIHFTKEHQSIPQRKTCFIGKTRCFWKFPRFQAIPPRWSARSYQP